MSEPTLKEKLMREMVEKALSEYDIDELEARLDSGLFNDTEKMHDAIAKFSSFSLITWADSFEEYRL